MMMVLVLLVSSMAGYALSRMNFPGRKTFLSLTLILHGFPAVTLLIAIFFVLRNIGKVPVVGDYFGFNTRGGIALVMVAFELPLGVWLMKGFFDNIPWDMERSALIDGASRWRTFWRILLPNSPRHPGPGHLRSSPAGARTSSADVQHRHQDGNAGRVYQPAYQRDHSGQLE